MLQLRRSSNQSGPMVMNVSLIQELGFQQHPWSLAGRSWLSQQLVSCWESLTVPPKLGSNSPTILFCLFRSKKCSDFILTCGEALCPTFTEVLSMSRNVLSSFISYNSLKRAHTCFNRYLFSLNVPDDQWEPCFPNGCAPCCDVTYCITACSVMCRVELTGSNVPLGSCQLSQFLWIEAMWVTRLSYTVSFSRSYIHSMRGVRRCSMCLDNH